MPKAAAAVQQRIKLIYAVSSTAQVCGETGCTGELGVQLSAATSLIDARCGLDAAETMQKPY